jgi:type I restriction enzyme S subunit
MRKGWTETTLDGIAEYLNGYPFKPSDLGEVGTPVVRIKQLLDPNEPLDRAVISIPQKNVLKDGDIVFSWSGTLAVRIWNRGPAFLNQHLFKVVEREGVTRNYLPLVIEHAIEELEEKSHGTTMKHITKQTLLPHKINLPPLQEQKRIVDLISSVDSYINALQQQAGNARKSRNAVLHEMLSAGGDGWEKVELGKIADVRDGTHDSPKPSITGYPLITSKNITGNRLSFKDTYLVSEKNFFEINKRSKVDRFDILISMIGTVGQAVLISEDPIFAIKNVGLIKTGDPELSTFLAAYLNSVDGQSQITSRTTGSTQKFIGLGSLRTLLVPLPPISERTRIIEIVVAMDEAIAIMEVTIAETKKLRSGLLSDLLSGDHEIPPSYDKIMGVA